MTQPLTEAEVDHEIEEAFDANYRALLAQGGAHLLTPRALRQAKEQVRYYWRKLRHVATTVTDTEVRLQLPNQKTPKGRTFVIEGVVDLVREGDRLRMYDIKTHYCEAVRAKPESYEAQLNVYAYIWQELRNSRLHEMGIIAVQLPDGLRRAIEAADPEWIRREAERWSPLVMVEYEQESLEAIFHAIADAVDWIEDGEFAPPSAATLREVVPQSRDQMAAGRYDSRAPTFATLHCRNCDGRFSCASYREYMSEPGRGARRPRFEMRKYVEEAFDDGELDEWIDGNITPDLEALYPDAREDEPSASTRREQRPGKASSRGRPVRSQANRESAGPKQQSRGRRQTNKRRLPVNVPKQGSRLRSLLDKLEADYGLGRRRVAKGAGVTPGTLAAYCSRAELPEAFRRKLRAYLEKQLG